MDTLIWIVVGLLAGVLFTAVAVMWLMQKKMVGRHRSQRSFEATCAAIENTVPAAKGWGFPIEAWEFHDSLRKKDLVPRGVKKLKIYFVCNAALARDVISARPEMAGIMPCGWAVYEMEDGGVWLAKMNIALMALMFSGVIRKAMSTVAEADERFLETVLAAEKEEPVPVGGEEAAA